MLKLTIRAKRKQRENEHIIVSMMSFGICLHTRMYVQCVHAIQRSTSDNELINCTLRVVSAACPALSTFFVDQIQFTRCATERTVNGSKQFRIAKSYTSYVRAICACVSFSAHDIGWTERSGTMTHADWNGWSRISLPCSNNTDYA